MGQKPFHIFLLKSRPPKSEDKGAGSSTDGLFIPLSLSMLSEKEETPLGNRRASFERTLVHVKYQICYNSGLCLSARVQPCGWGVPTVCSGCVEGGPEGTGLTLTTQTHTPPVQRLPEGACNRPSDIAEKTPISKTGQKGVKRAPSPALPDTGLRTSQPKMSQEFGKPWGDLTHFQINLLI